MITPFLLAAGAAFLLAFANGANDNSKGVATLIGSGLLGPRLAVVYGTVMTFLGSMAALLLAGALLRTFRGQGIVPESMLTNPAFPVSVAMAAAVTVLLATRLGLPISTTHAIVGAMVGVGLAGELIWAGVWTKFAWPLLAAPVIAAGLTAPVYLIFRWTRRRLRITRTSCVCFERPEPSPTLAASRIGGRVDGIAGTPARLGRVRPGHRPDCEETLTGTIVGVDAQTVLDRSHFLTAGAVSFARGLNDTPKIAAILLAAGAIAGSGGLGPGLATLAVGVGMALGGTLAARRVAITMGHKITGMNDGQAFTANLVTAILVIFASRFGVPVSTTHVSCGSLFGIGAVNGAARWRTISIVVMAWVTTLPLAAAIGWLAWRLLA